MGEPRSAATLDEALQREVRTLLTQRLAAEGPVSEAAHAILIVVVAAITVAFLRWQELVPWVLAVFAATGVRAGLRRRALRRDSRAGLLRAVRIGVAINGLAWGIGIRRLGPSLPSEALAWNLVAFAGIVAGATVALLPDPVSYYTLTVTMLGSIAVAIGREAGYLNTVGVVVVAMYGGAMSTYYRRMHTVLVNQLTTAKRPELTERAAADERAMLDALIAGAPTAIAVVDPLGTVRRVNRSFERVFGFGAGQIVGRRSTASWCFRRT